MDMVENCIFDSLKGVCAVQKFYSYSNIFRRTFNGRTSIKYSNITRREEDAAIS